MEHTGVLCHLKGIALNEIDRSQKGPKWDGKRKPSENQRVKVVLGIPSPATATARATTMSIPKWTQIGTHTGRRTFICLALSNGVPPQVVMKWTGHCDYKSMKPYIDITEDAKRDAIKKM